MVVGGDNKPPGSINKENTLAKRIISSFLVPAVCADVIKTKELPS
jgi:hypothetical protein